MKNLLTTLAALTVIATPALAQSFDPDNGTGNVLSLAPKPTAPLSNKITVRHGGVRAHVIVSRTRSVHVTRG